MDVFFSDEDRYEYLHEMAEQGERFGVTFHARARGLPSYFVRRREHPC